MILYYINDACDGLMHADGTAHHSCQSLIIDPPIAHPKKFADPEYRVVGQLGRPWRNELRDLREFLGTEGTEHEPNMALVKVTLIGKGRQWNV